MAYSLMDRPPKRPQVLLYSPGINPFLEDLTKFADQVFYFEEVLPKPAQATLEAFS
ncbi:MAG: hypothetical protein MUO26_01665 [Methanotrichaceae archaeon]|nr:hypothetical protein [Methanotrichaceae archaeon]